MFYINLLENLKVYISSRPPLVVFMISVSAMAIAFLTLGYFFKIKEIKSPEMTEVCAKMVFIWKTCLKFIFFPPLLESTELCGGIVSVFLQKGCRGECLLVLFCIKDEAKSSVMDLPCCGWEPFSLLFRVT